ncbi:MAG: hypothetical protein WBA46_12715, partial [Thermomicrobiales bacterium]
MTDQPSRPHSHDDAPESPAPTGSSLNRRRFTVGAVGAAGAVAATVAAEALVTASAHAASPTIAFQ